MKVVTLMYLPKILLLGLTFKETPNSLNTMKEDLSGVKKCAVSQTFKLSDIK